MSVQPLERTDLQLIESLDFEHTPRCESTSHATERFVHAGSASSVLRMVMSCCGKTVTGYRCAPFTKYALEVGVFRCDCPAGYASANVTVLGHVGGVE